MRLVITGGGTGGHIYPALEVARLAAERGAQYRYLGSLRGQESSICAARGIVFDGLDSRPLYSLRTWRGWASAMALLQARRVARTFLRAWSPDAVFSTGGYSAAPVMSAAASIGIPYTIHEANSVPGRSNRLFGRRAASFTTTFRKTSELGLGFPVTRTGQPVRVELREAAQTREAEPKTVLVVGGSQGSAFLNDLVPIASRRLARDTRVIHAAGRAHIEAIRPRVADLAHYEAVPYLEEAELIAAYRHATVAIGRSGGTLAEFAVFGLPSVLVPLPGSADDHQLHNAREFESMGAAVVVIQSSADAPALAGAVQGWLDDADRRRAAAAALCEWDMPDATARIVDLLERAGSHR